MVAVLTVVRPTPLWGVAVVGVNALLNIIICCLYYPLWGVCVVFS